MTRSTRKLFSFGLLVAIVAAIGVGAYFINDGKAKDRGAGKKGPPAAPVTVAAVAQRSVPMQLHAIGNVEPYSTVAIKARVDGQIVAVNFREGQAV